MRTVPLRVTRTVILRVKGMHCSGCEQTIEQALERVPGVHRVKASYVTATVEMDADDGLSLDEGVRRAIDSSCVPRAS